MEKNTWEEYSQYILITVEKLAKAIEETNRDHQKHKEKTLESLTSLRISLLERVQKANDIVKKDMEPIIKRLEDLISNMDKDFSDLKEKIILPLRIKVAVISVICGAVGGLLVTIISHLILKVI
jgi:DNA-directed RNA polymerase alpha subunit